MVPDQKLLKPFFDIYNNEENNRTCNQEVPGSNPRQAELKPSFRSKNFFYKYCSELVTDEKLQKTFFDICNNKLSNQPCNWNVPGSNPRPVKLKLTPVP